MTDAYTIEEIKIPAYDGGAFGTYMAIPENVDENNPAPAIIFIQEIFGINAEMREKCETYAAKGYIAICPDLFWRIEPNIQLIDSDPAQLERAFDLFGKFDATSGIEDLKTTLGFMRNHKSCNGKVGSIGYCLGGHLSYRLAAASDINASVSYYGVEIDKHLDEAEKITSPILLHIAGEDEFVPKAAQAQITEALSNRPQAEAHTYEGLDHAFARGNGIHYDKAGATLASGRTEEFLKKNLS